MHTLITGGAGFIGSHLTERLLAEGNRVTIVDDFSTGRPRNVDHLLDDGRCTLIENTIRDDALMDRLIGECDRVFHLAAAVGVNLIVERPVHTIETNIHGSEVVLSAAAKHRRTILLTSTSEVYGKASRTPFREDDDVVYGNTTLQRWSYAVSKAVDEFLGLAYHREVDLPIVIVRLFNTVGPRQTGQYGMVVPRFIKSALTNEPIRVYGDGQQSRCFADVSDAISAMIGLINEPQAVGQVFNVGADIPITIEQLAQRIIELTDSSSHIEYVPYDQAYAPGFEDMRVRQPSLDKIKAATGYTPSATLDETLARMIEWTRQDQSDAPAESEDSNRIRLQRS